MSTDALVSLAILKVNWDWLGRDYIENFVPFVAEALRQSPPDDVVSLPVLQTDLRQRFGLDLPLNPLRQVLQRAARHNFVRRQSGVFYRNPAQLATLNFAEVRNAVVSIHDRLLKESIPAGSLTKLGFAISGRSGEGAVYVSGNPKHGYCTGGSPRFVVESTGSPVCHLGCNHGATTGGSPAVQDPATRWWDISFVPPFSDYPGCPVAPSGMIEYMDITVDEGPDTSVTLDNITATIGGKTTVVGKPTGDGDDHDDD